MNGNGQAEIFQRGQPSVEKVERDTVFPRALRCSCRGKESSNERIMRDKSTYSTCQNSKRQLRCRLILKCSKLLTTAAFGLLAVDALRMFN